MERFNTAITQRGSEKNAACWAWHLKVTMLLWVLLQKKTDKQNNQEQWMHIEQVL